MEFTTREAYFKAVQLHGSDYNGMQLVVNAAGGGGLGPGVGAAGDCLF